MNKSIDFTGKIITRKTVKAVFIGCGSHSFRNIYPVFQFTPIELSAVCDLNQEKADAFAERFSNGTAYTDYHEMLEKEKPDAVFIVTNYDDKGRPRYKDIACSCMKAGCHVWMEKPPAGACKEIEEMQALSKKTGKIVFVGFKKMFAPANEKAKQLMTEKEFGKVSSVLIQYPQAIPTNEEFAKFRQNELCWPATGFLDHLCHPASLMVYLLGMPVSLYFERSVHGSGIAVFSFKSGAIATIALNSGASVNGGMEYTKIISDQAMHITVENNIRLTYHRMPSLPYGASPDFFQPGPEQVSAVWEPEFSLGQLYNKGLFLLGYYNEINEFAQSILENFHSVRGTLDDAWNITRIFEAFFDGPQKRILI